MPLPIPTPATLTLDGALATLLESRGAELNHPLWSAKILLENPSSIRKVHYDYYLAGASVAITASYQATERGLAESYGMDSSAARDLIILSVKLAAEARASALETLTAEYKNEDKKSASNVDQHGRPQRAPKNLLVAGSVGPYGAYLSNGSEYTGDYGNPFPSLTDFKSFHRLRMRALVDAGVDILALETMPCIVEVHALLELLQEEFQGVKAWVSVTLNEDASGMADETTLEELCKRVVGWEHVVALGVNCVPRRSVMPGLRRMKVVLEEMGAVERVRLLAYPNSGEVWDARSKTWSGTGEGGDGRGWEELVEEWKEVGVGWIGGCCRTGPEEIARIRNVMGES